MDNLNDFCLDEFYKEYGETLASRLPEIAHTNVKPAFVFVAEIDNPVEVKELANNKQITTDGPILVWDNFDEDIDSGGRDNFHSTLKCSLSVLFKETKLFTRAQAFRQARAIILKALSVMIQDAQSYDENGSLCEVGIQMDIQQFPLEKIGPVSGQWYGRGVQFSWIVPVDLTYDESALYPAS